MELSGTVEIAAPRQAVWDQLLDFEGLASCGPGVESVARLDERRTRIAAKVGVGFMNVAFTIDLELAEVAAPDRAVIRAKGEAPGNTVEATGRMSLSGPPEGPTEMAWTADVELIGAIAGIGSRMVESVAHRLIEQTFDCVRTRLAAAT
jgi:carbon monoxide dehydrogenase subunit G